MVRFPRIAGRWYQYLTDSHARNRLARVGLRLVPRIGGGAGFTFVQAGVGNANANSTAIFFSSITAGNHLIAVTGTNLKGGDQVSDTKGNTWNGPVDALDTSGVEVAIWWATNVAGGTTTVTYQNTSGSFNGIAVAEFSYSSPGAITLNQHAAPATGTSASPASSSITPASGDLVIGGLCEAGGSGVTITPGGSFLDGPTHQFSNPNGNQSVGGEYILSSGGTSTSATWTLGSSQSWDAAIASFSPPVSTPDPGYDLVFLRKTPLRKSVGPQVLRMQHWAWEGRNWEILPDPGTTYVPPIVIPHPFVGPQVMRYTLKRRLQRMPIWDISSANAVIFVTASDVLGAISDTATRLIALPRTASDSLAALSDVANRLIALPRTATDALSALSDTATRLIALPRTASDALGALSDSAVRSAMAFNRTASDTLSALSDVANRTLVFLRTAADSLGALSDTATRLIALPRTASDALSAISDSAVRSAMVFTRTASDTLSALSDAANRVVAFSRTAADTIAALSDSAIVQKGISRTASDAISAISDSAVRSLMAFQRTASDTLAAVSDVANRLIVLSRTTSDIISALSDVASRAIALPRIASDALATISDSAIRSAMTLQRTATDAISALSDTAVRSARSSLRTALDALASLTDSATVPALVAVFVSFVVYGRSGILKVAGRTGSFVSQSRSGIFKVLSRTGIAKFFGRRSN